MIIITMTWSNMLITRTQELHPITYTHIIISYFKPYNCVQTKD